MLFLNTTALSQLTTDVSLSGTAQGDIFYRGSSQWNNLAHGNSGDVLTSGGANANPAWSASSVIIANTLFVDATNGNDSTAIVGRVDKPYLTLQAAQTAATAGSGQLIYVRLGSYSITATLGKNGVNWYFEEGTTVDFTQTDVTGANHAVWGTVGFSCVYQVRGYGTFNRTVTAHSTGTFASCITCATGANLYVECLDLNLTDTASIDPTTIGPRGIFQSGGTLYVKCRNLTVTGVIGTGGSDTTGEGIWWQNGEMSIHGRQLVVTDRGIYSDVTSAPTGDCHVHFDDMKANNPTVYTAGTNTDAAVWVRADTIRNTLFGNSISLVGSEKVYVEAQKLFGSISVTGNGLLYVRADKIAAITTGVLTNFGGSGSTSWISINDWDTTTITSSVISCSDGTVNIIGGTLRSDTASFGLNISGGTLRFHGTRIDTSSNLSANPVTISGGTLSLEGVTLVAGGSQQCITASSSQTVILNGTTSYNTTNSGNITFSSSLLPVAPVTSVFTRTGAVVATSGDYTAAQVTNAVSTLGSYANPSWITSLAETKVLPTQTGNSGKYLTTNGSVSSWGSIVSGVSSVFTRTGAVTATSGDYTAAQVTNAADTTSTYSNPSWITSLAETKVLPTQTSNSGKFLTTNGTSSSWATAVTAAAGSSGQLQYNNSGAFGGTAAWVYATSGNLLTGTAQVDADVPLSSKYHSATQSGNLFQVLDASNNVRGGWAIQAVTGDPLAFFLRPNSRSFYVTSSEGNGSIRFGWSTNTNYMDFIPNDDSLVFNRDDGGTYCLFRGNNNVQNFVITASQGGGTTIVDFNRRPSDDHPLVGGQVRFWTKTGQIIDAVQILEPGGAASRLAFDPSGVPTWSQQSSTTSRAQFNITPSWATSTDATRKARVTLNVYDTAVREVMRGEADGSNPMIGFLGASAVVKQVSGANLTNNVTSGGTTDQIDDFTSLTVYATDAATIRNDIYQLARKVAQINNSLRLYGLLT